MDLNAEPDVIAETNGDHARFVVDVDGYEGPIDVLLALARDQKVDLTQISIVQLADQYLEFVAEARRVDLELAAEYLVMAAWLAFLKSRLLLPELGSVEELSAEAMAAALTFQLQRLQAMRDAGARLMARNRLGQEVFVRGAPEQFGDTTFSVFEVTLYDLLKAYGDQRRRTNPETLHIEAWELESVESALNRLTQALGRGPDWEHLWRFLPPGTIEGLRIGRLSARSALASTFAASLELVREGRARIRQGKPFGPIYLSAGNGGDTNG